MNIGELFLNLGISGTEKTVGQIAGVKKGLSETASGALEAKVAIVAAMYALERLVSASGASGTGLTNFGITTGISTETLQKYQFAARQAGVANEEVTGSFHALQNSMAAMARGEGAPKGLLFMAQKLGGMNFERAKHDVPYLIQEFQKFSQMDLDPAMKRWALSTLGFSEGMVAAMERGKFTDAVMDKAPTYSPAEIAELDRANIAWTNLGMKIQMAIGHLNAKHGGRLVQDISHITDSVIRLSTTLLTLADRFKVFQTVGHMLEGVTNTLNLFNDIMTKMNGGEVGKDSLLHTKPGQDAVPGLSNSPLFKFFQNMFSGEGANLSGKLTGSNVDIPMPAGLPAMAAVPHVAGAHGSSSSKTYNVKQDLHFNHPGTDAKRTGDSARKGAQDAIRQNPTQGQAS